MIRHKDILLHGASGREMLLDIHLPDTPLPIANLVFCHGFKGFKDWGHWGLIAEELVKMDFAFIKFNFSHNGTTVDHPSEFNDLESFGYNNFTKELLDLDAVLKKMEVWKSTSRYPLSDNTILIGHSRGGPICLLTSANNESILSTITWASVSKLDYAWPDKEMINIWKQNGVYHILNGRTKQEMPLYFQLYEDFQKNEDAFDVHSALKKMSKPLCFIHGSSDPAVSSAAARELYELSRNGEVHLISGADHVFGGKHPFDADSLPPHSQELVKITGQFAKRILQKV